MFLNYSHTLIEFDLEGNAKLSYLDRAFGDLISGVKRHTDKLSGTEYTHLRKGIHTPNRCLEFRYWLSPNQQDDREDKQPFVYGSRKLLPRETKHSVIELEVLTIVEGVKHFRVYLEGVPFWIETDHNPFTQRSQLKDSYDALRNGY